MSPPTIAVEHRRRLKYIDHALQRWLLIALVLLQVALVGLSTWLMDLRLHTLLEESLYRSHFTRPGPDFQTLLREGGLMIAAFIMVNVIALIIADGLWAGYVNAVLKGFRDPMRRAAKLDFTPLPEPPVDHEVLRLRARWLSAERQRLAILRGQSRQLEQAAAQDPPDRERLRQLMAQMRGSLPPPSSDILRRP